GSPHAHTIAQTGTTTGGTVVPVVSSAGDDALRARLGPLEAEKQRMRAGRLRDGAESFVTSQQAALKLFDPQRSAVAALYVQLASDDEVRGAIRAADGSEITRVQLLANYFASVPSPHELR